MENSKQTNHKPLNTAMNTKVNEHLEMLKDSKIVKSEFYYIDINNLCEAISMLAKDSGFDIELIQKSNSIAACLHLIESIQKRFWFIETLSKEIQDKVSGNDYSYLETLFYWYNNPE